MRPEPRSPKVLHLIDTGGPGGAETVFLSLAAHGQAKGRNAAVVIPYAGWLAERLGASGIRPVTIPSRGSANARFLARLVQVARATGTNLFHTHLLGSAVYAAMAGLLLRIPVIAVFHGSTDLRDSGSLSAAKRWLLLRPHVSIVAVSDAVKAALVDWGLPPRRIRVIRNGVNATEFTPGPSRLVQDELGLPPDTKIIGAVGNIRRPKAYEILVDAARHVIAARPDVHFAITGSGTERDVNALQARAESARISRNVHFLGFRQSVPERYRSFAAFVSSARSEGLPLSFLEAMSCGIPIVATDNEGSGPLLRETGAGLLSPVDSPVDLAEAILKLLSDSRLSDTLAANGVKAVSDRFSLDRTLEAYEALYQLVMAGGAPPSQPP